MSKTAFLLAFSSMGVAWAKEQDCHADGTCDVHNKENNTGDDEVNLLALRGHFNFSSLREEAACQCWGGKPGCNCGFRTDYDSCVTQCDCKWTREKPRGCLCKGGRANSAVGTPGIGCDEAASCKTGCGFRKSPDDCTQENACEWNGEQIEFKEFKSKWVWKGQNVQGRSYSVSIAKSDQSTYQNALSVGLSATVKLSAGIPFVVTGETAITLSSQYTHTWTKSVTESVTQTVTTMSPDCSNGNLWQYGLEAYGTVKVDADKLPGRSISFVCILDKLGDPKTRFPRCPPGYCYDSACFCCNGFHYAKEEASVREYVAKGRGGDCESPINPDTGKPVIILESPANPASASL